MLESEIGQLKSEKAQIGAEMQSVNQVKIINERKEKHLLWCIMTDIYR